MPETPKRFIKYTAYPGIVSERRITKSDFASVGLEHETVSFHRGNRFMVDATDMPDEVVEVFKEDPDFTISTKDNAPRLMAPPGSLGGSDGPVAGLTAQTAPTARSAGTTGTSTRGTGGTTGARSSGGTGTSG